MAPTPLFPLVDRILGGDLTDRLRRERSTGISYEQIARGLRDTDRAIPVGAETVRKWCLELDIEADPDRAAS